MAGDLVQSWDEDRILNSDSHAQENVWKRSTPNDIFCHSCSPQLHFGECFGQALKNSGFEINTFELGLIS